MGNTFSCQLKLYSCSCRCCCRCG